MTLSADGLEDFLIHYPLELVLLEPGNFFVDLLDVLLECLDGVDRHVGGGTVAAGGPGSRHAP